MNVHKAKTWEILCDSEKSTAEKRESIARYEDEFPKDMDIYLMKMQLLEQEGRLDDACKEGEQAAKRNPYMLEVQFMLAGIYEKQGRYLEAYKLYIIAKLLGKCAQNDQIQAECEQASERVIARLEYVAQEIKDEYQKKLLNQAITNMLEYEKSQFGYKEIRFHSYVNIVGDYYYENESNKKYIGMYHTEANTRRVGNERDMIHLKGEIREVTEGTWLQLPNENKEWIVPLAVQKENTIHQIQNIKGESVRCIQRYNKSFYYYRVAGGDEILSSDICYYGKPIPVINDKSKKRLVLSVFVDGIAYELLSKGELERQMPNTAKYFAKGMVCQQAYSSGEWTYPSIAGFMSGLATSKHMMFHNELDGKLPCDVKTLMEYFHDAGYYTSAFSGDLRIIPSYGYARGCDRFIYQLQHTGFSIEKMIGNVIDEIEALKEINQYVWVSIGDLHDIADERELPTSVQTGLSAADREFQMGNITSVKQVHSAAKGHQYEKMLQYVDRYLGMLFQYLENTYEDDEILVSLFSDHGQGYLVPDGGEFLGPERSNIAFMFRDGKNIGTTDEIMSSLDYTAIMCKLAGLTYEEDGTSGRIPRTFGGKGRKWALTESLHPNDWYRAALVSDQYRFYFCNHVPVGYDGRFELGEYTAYLTDKQGNIQKLPEVEQECMDIILDQIAYLCIY